jgi:hypothetical protein
MNNDHLIFSQKCFQTWVLWLVVCVFFFSYHSLHAQEKEGQPPEKSLRLGVLMDTLSHRFNLDFAYDAGVVNSDSLVHVVVPDSLDNQWVSSLFDQDGVEVSFMGNQVIIRKQAGKLADKNILFISGKVVGGASNDPLYMVNVGVEGQSVGTTTNDLGQFSFKVPDSMAGMSMVFSYLGFVSSRIEIPAKDTAVIIHLKEYAVRLPEVQVLYRDPNQIVRAVKSAVEANYPLQPYLMTAFFRETIQQDERFVDVSEAVVEILKPSYSDRYDVERVRFVKGRKGKESREMDVVQFKLAGGPYHFSQLDVMRNGDFLPNEVGESAYKYTFDGVDIIYDRLVYRVGFKPYNDTNELFYEGEMRIEAETMAMVSIDFQLTPASIRRSRSFLIKRDARRFRTRPFYAKYKVEYRPWKNGWVLSNVRGEVSVRIYDRSKRERSVFDTVSEMLVTDFSVAGQRHPIPWSETYKSDYVLSDHLGEFDPDFWEHYNVIQADEALEKVLNR